MLNFVNRSLNKFRLASESKGGSEDRKSAKKRAAILRFENLEDRQLLTTISGLYTGTTNFNDTSSVYEVVSPGVTIASGATMNFGANTKVQIDSGTFILDKGTLNFASGDEVTFIRNYGNATTLEVASGAKLSSTGATFDEVDNDSDYSSAGFYVDPGGRLIASGTEFSLDSVTLSPGATLNSGDIATSTFDTTLYIPSAGIGLITNNKHFHTIFINDTGPTNSQTITLKQIGTDTNFSNLQYDFNNAFTVRPGVTLAIGANTSVVLQGGASIYDKGSVTAAAGSAITQLRIYNAHTAVEVASGGTLNSTGATFNEIDNDSDYSSAGLYIDPGARLISSNTEYSLDSVTLSPGATLNSGDIATSTFDTTLYIPSVGIGLIANNKHFDTIFINDTGPSATQTIPLKQIGTDGNFSNLQYDFNNAYVVQPGVTLAIGANTSVVLQGGSSIYDKGSVTAAAGSAITQLRIYNAHTAVEVASGGTLNSTGATFNEIDNDSDYSSAGLYIDPGARLISSNTEYSLDSVTLSPGATLNSGDIATSTFDTTLYIPSVGIGLIANNKHFDTIFINDTGPSATQTITLKQIGTDGNFSNLQYDFNNAFTVQPGVTLAIGANTSVVLQGGASIYDKGSVTAAAGSAITQLRIYNAHTAVEVASGGTLNSTGATFNEIDNDSDYSSAGLYIDPGARLISSNTEYSLDSVTLSPGAILNSGDIATSTFDTTLYIPSAGIALISNNKHFDTIFINDTGPTNSQTIPLKQIGTDKNFSNLQYDFNNAYTVQPGVTLAIGANTSVVLQGGASIYVKGSLTAAAGSAITQLRTYNVHTSVEVASGGTLNATGSTFNETDYDSDYSSAGLYIDPGARLISSNTEYSLDSVTLSPGATINSNDIATSTFDTTLYIPSTGIGLITNNKHFHDIVIDDSSLPTNQALALSVIGTDGNVNNLRYLFLNPFTISPGAAITIYSNVTTVVDPNVTILDQGTLNLTSGSTLTFAKSYGSTSSFEVASGGTLNASGATVQFDAPQSYSTFNIEVDGGGKINATNSAFSPDYFNLIAGSSGTLASDTFQNEIDISNGTTVGITGNSFANTSVIYAYGSSTGTVNLVGNYWGTASPAAIVVDHSDDATRPTANVNPVQTNISTPGALTTIAAQAVTSVYSAATHALTLSAQVNGPTVVNEGTVTFTIYSGTKIVGSPITVNVVNGVATASNYLFPGSMGGGGYGIRALYSGTANFIGSIDQSAKLTVTGAPTTTVASVGVFSVAAGQSAPLSAVVTSPNGIVNQGSVTFTLMNGSNVIGTALQGTVVNGVASVSYLVPSGTAAQAYQVMAVYNTSASFLSSSDASNLPSLTVSAAASTTAVVAPSAPITFSETSSQTVSMTANVTSAGGTVASGTVVFTILVGNQVVGQATSGAVSNGQATATYTIPAGTPASSYIVQAAYNGTASFGGSSDATQHFTINAASTTTTAASVSGSIGRSVGLSASVTSPAGVVNEGTETFTILNGTTVVGTLNAYVLNGAAGASFVIPSSLATGNYTINAVYNPTTNFTASSDATQTLTAVQASTTTNTVGSSQAVFSEAAQSVTLSTMITSTAGAVNGGTVTFTVMNGATVIGTAKTSATVNNGYASVTYQLPTGMTAGSYNVSAVYSGVPAFLPSTSSSSLKPLVISPAVTSAVGVNQTASVSAIPESVSLSATVTSNGANISRGSVIFKIYKADGVSLIVASASQNVVNGVVSTNLTLPANLAAGTYIIDVLYTDSSGDYQAFTDPTHKLVIS